VLPWAGGHDLWASRALTVAFSLVTLAALWALARRLFGEGTATLAALFYVLCPFTLFHDRLFLADPAMSTFVALALLASVRLAETARMREGVLAGLAVMLVVLAKASGVLLLFVPAAAWLAFARPVRRGWTALGAAYLVAGLLLAFPAWYFLRVTSAVRLATGGSEAPSLARAAQNLALLGEWLPSWGTWPLCALAVAGAAAALARRQAAGLLLAAVALVPLALLAPVATVWYPRYVLFVALPGLILAARALVEAVEWVAPRLRLPPRGRAAALVAASALVLAPSVANDLWLWTDPSRARMPAIDRFQYVDGWPSGYGVRDTVALVAAERARHREGITVVVWSRALPTTVMALRRANRRDPGVRIEDLPLDEPAQALPLLAAWAREHPTLVVVSVTAGHRQRPSPAAWAPLGATLVAETRKPSGELCDAVYRLAPPASSP
jgi:4-amino-4-deoxy-L-arabinose transferase-like glycosyltransferase